MWSPLVPRPVGPSTEAWSCSLPLPGVTASASTVPTSWWVNTTADRGGAGNARACFGADDVAWVGTAGALDAVVETGPGVRWSRTTTITTPATPTESAAMPASSRRITVGPG